MPVTPRREGPRGRGDVVRFQAEHKFTVGFGFGQGDRSRTFSFYSDRRAVCCAGNLVRWETLNKKGEGGRLLHLKNLISVSTQS